MNLKYVEPTGHDYPKQIETTITASKEHGTSTCCTFNRRGTLLAIGCASGTINIWDFETRAIALRLQEHKGIVTSVSWSRNGSKLLSSDWSGLLLLWDITTAAVLIKVEFNIAIEHSWLHGRSSKLAMIHLHECQPLILTFDECTKNLSKSEAIAINLSTDDDKRIKIINHSAGKYKLCAKSIELSHFLPNDSLSSTTSSKKKKTQKKARITCAVFDKYSKHIYCGTSHGRLLIIEYKTWKVINADIANSKITNSCSN